MRVVPSKKKASLSTVAVLLGLLMGSVAMTGSVGVQSVEPEEEHEWTGFIGCSLNYPTAFQPWECHDENNDYERVFTVQPGLKTLVVAMEWETPLICTADYLRHWLYIPADASRASVRMEEGSPIEYRIDVGDDFDEITEPTDFRFRVWGPTQGPQFCYQQTFQVHYHLFYSDHADDGYSALP